ncbi:unnamed protein product [Calypogeia fissa]
MPEGAARWGKIVMLKLSLWVLNVDVLQRLNNVNDEAKLTLNISGDLRSVFTWNTKQAKSNLAVFLWGNLEQLFVLVVAEYKTPKNQINQVSLWGFNCGEKGGCTQFPSTEKQICLCGPSTCL